MTLVLALLSRYWTQIAVVVVSGIVIAWAHHTIYQKGWDARDAEWKADTEKREAFGRAERERLQLAYNQITINASTVAALQARKREVEFRDVIRHTTIYKASPDAGKCHIPLEFMCHIDTAYVGLPEGAFDTCRKDAAAGRISDAAVFHP